MDQLQLIELRVVVVGTGCFWLVAVLRLWNDEFLQHVLVVMARRNQVHSEWRRRTISVLKGLSAANIRHFVLNQGLDFHLMLSVIGTAGTGETQNEHIGRC